MTPLALTVLPQPKDIENKNQGVRTALAFFMRWTGGNFAVASAILLIMLGLSVAGGILFASKVQLGESEPGSPLLKHDHVFNTDTNEINSLFPGSEELHVLFWTDEKGGIKQPEVIHAIERFQNLMLTDLSAGGTKALPAVVRTVNRLTHNDDPRWKQIPDSAAEIGGLMFAYMASSPIPNALKEFVNSEDNEANVIFYYKDHQAQTVSRAIALAEEGIKEIVPTVPGLHIDLAGGTIGVIAGATEALHHDHMIIIPLVMVLAFILVMAYYQSVHAGWLMVLPMMFATLMTYAYMGWKGIGINVNTVPVIAVGVGVGIDYAVYFMDRIREEMSEFHDIKRSVINAFATTGYAVSFTATMLISGVIMWVFMSDLRFQSDAAMLLSFMLVVNAIAAMLLVPAWCVVFKPKFVMNASGEPHEAVRKEHEHPAAA